MRRSKTWPRDGIISQASLAASIAVVALLGAATLSPFKIIWS